ncbi:MAG: UDP-2,3-diacylglucosamine diphosphatase LpxI [Deltaproteobacteria bacterium]|jgi:DUF1009 family protein|nr:UDP-2,3-diacylglucosamine diphosphatase LpxI [Deltaproteobacteria bacterium]
MAEIFPDPVGLIAGNLNLPILVAEKIKAQGLPLCVVGIKGEVSKELSQLADHYLELPLGKLKPLAEFFLLHGCFKVCLAGGISRETILLNYSPDAAALKVLENLPNFQTDTLLRAIGLYLESQSLKLVSVIELAPEIVVPIGQLSRAAPSPALLEDLSLAFTLAKYLGKLDVGQTVVVENKIAIALEGADGTDATIRRGASLCQNPISVAKVVKPRQDTRFDLPVVGPHTLTLLAELKAGGLVLDAGALILLEAQKSIEIADKAGIVLLAWKEPPLVSLPNVEP